MASVWIGSWGLFAVDEVGASLTHILEKNDLEIKSSTMILGLRGTLVTGSNFENSKQI